MQTMKLIRPTPSVFARVTDFDDWLRHPLASMPSLGQFFSQLGEVFPGGTSDKMSVDVHEDKDAYYAHFELPGVKNENVKIELNDCLITVTAEKREKNGDSESRCALSRSVSVPDGVNVDAIVAKLEDGILNLTLPKAEHKKPRAIELN